MVRPVEGDVGRNLSPETAAIVSGMSDEQAAEYYDQLREKGDLPLEASENVRPFNAADFVSPANQMTGRTFGMNDVDVLKEYDMFTDVDVENKHETESVFASPGVHF